MTLATNEIESRDPWSLIKQQTSDAFTIKRADTGIDWDIFWALSPANEPSLILQCDSDSLADVPKLPKLKEIDLELVDDGRSGAKRFILRLLSPEQRDLFHSCLLYTSPSPRDRD